MIFILPIMIASHFFSLIKYNNTFNELQKDFVFKF